MVVANVDRDHEPFTQCPYEASERVLVGERGGSDDDAGRARLQQELGIGDRADAARGLYSRRRRDERRAADEVGADPAVARAVEVDEVDQVRAGVAVGLDECEWVGAVRDLLVVASPKPHGIGSQEIDRRYDAGTCRCRFSLAY